MLRANGEGVPVGDRSEIRAGVAIMGGGPAGVVAAGVIRQQAPKLSIVIIEAPADLPAALAATVLTGVALERVETSDNRIDRLRLTDGRTVVADWYVGTSHSAGERANCENSIDCGGYGDANSAVAIGRAAGWTIVALHNGEHDRSWLTWSFHEAKRRNLNELQRRSSGQAPEIHRCNIVKPNLVGAQRGTIAVFQSGRVQPVPCHTRDGKALPITGIYAQLLEALKHHTVIADVLIELQQPGHPPLEACIDGLEAMLQDGWLIGKLDRRRPLPEWPDDAKPSATISTFAPSRESIQKNPGARPRVN